MAREKGLGQIEAVDLKRVVREIEGMLATGTALTGSANTMVLGHLLETSKNRIIELEREEATTVAEEREKGLKEISAAVIVAQREAALNMEERRQFAEFLEKDHFTKADFGSLEKFYQSAWDRLSEDGKAEMSHRIWEGVRRKEYEFSELPEIVKQKEAERLRDQLSHVQISADLQRIPESDREDFLRAWEEGKRKEAYEVLDRPVFAESVALSSKSIQVESAKLESVQEASGVTKEETRGALRSEPAKGNALASVELKLDDVKLTSQEGDRPVAPAIGSGPSERAR